jgi:hypothetical protein
MGVVALSHPPSGGLRGDGGLPMASDRGQAVHPWIKLRHRNAPKLPQRGNVFEKPECGRSMHGAALRADALRPPWRRAIHTIPMHKVAWPCLEETPWCSAWSGDRALCYCGSFARLSGVQRPCGATTRQVTRPCCLPFVHGRMQEIAPGVASWSQCAERQF